VNLSFLGKQGNIVNLWLLGGRQQYACFWIILAGVFILFAFLSGPKVPGFSNDSFGKVKKGGFKVSPNKPFVFRRPPFSRILAKKCSSIPIKIQSNLQTKCLNILPFYFSTNKAETLNHGLFQVAF
jgi:hypothetical protein